MEPETPQASFDLFISYAHADDRGDHLEKVTALVGAVKADYGRVIGATLNVFFDTHAIRTMDDWEARILTGLRQSRMMVAVLSPNYFQSDFCRREWEVYVETELAQALPGDGITPIYVVRHSAFEADPVEEQLRHWIKDLRKRHYIEWHPFWPEGARALEREDVRRKLADLPGQIKERLERAAIRDKAPNNVPLPSDHFVGRRDETHALLKDLIQSQIGVITAVHGIPGIGKSMLAFAYAWGYGYKYPGGRFMIPAADLTDLAAGMIALAEPKGVALGDEERRNPQIALAKVKAAFEAGQPALIVIDNVDTPAPLEPQARERALPKGDHIHVLVTTRISPDGLPRIRCLPLDALSPDDAMALLHSFRPIADSPQDDEWKAALEVAHRLGCHALAIEVVAVFLRENPTLTYRVFAKSLEERGFEVLEDVAPEARGRLTWHAESGIARLLEPTLAALDPVDLRAVEYAAFLPPDNVPLPWLRDLLVADFPNLAKPGLVDPLSATFKRLERLRLVVPQTQQRGARPTPGASPGEERLARMHRLVQDAIRNRLNEDEQSSRQEIVYDHADERGRWLIDHWGQLGLAWELPTLRDVALRRIDDGDRGGVLLGDRIGTPLLHLGRMLEVHELRRRTSVMFKRLSAAAPEDANYARDLSISFDRLGDLASSAGDLAGALRFYQDELEIALYLSAAAPENAHYARDLSVGFGKLGDLARSAGDPAAARRFYQDGLEIRNRLSAAAPENADYARDLSISFNKLGDLAMSTGDPAAARRFYQDGLEIAQRLSAAAPENADYARDLSTSFGRLGDLAMSAGDPATARRFYQDGLEIRRRLYDAASENADYARDLWVSCWKMAVLAESHEATDDARSWWIRAHEVLAGLKLRGVFVSAEDEGFLKQIRQKLGLP